MIEEKRELRWESSLDPNRGNYRRYFSYVNKGLRDSNRAIYIHKHMRCDMRIACVGMRRIARGTGTKDAKSPSEAEDTDLLNLKTRWRRRTKTGSVEKKFPHFFQDVTSDGPARNSSWKITGKS